MPPAVKKGIAQTILVLMGSTFIIGLMGWMGLELVQSHDNNIKSDHVVLVIDEIKEDTKAFISRQDAMMSYIFENQTDIKLIKTNLNHCVADVGTNIKQIEACRQKHSKGGH